MTCDDLDMTLARKATGDLTSEESRQFRDHADHCPRCAEGAERFERQLEDLEHLARMFAAAEPAEDRIPQFVGARPSRGRSTIVRLATAGLAAAAAVLLILSLTPQPNPAPRSFVDSRDSPNRSRIEGYRTPRFVASWVVDQSPTDQLTTLRRLPTFVTAGGRDSAIRVKTASMILKRRSGHDDLVDWKP